MKDTYLNPNKPAFPTFTDCSYLTNAGLSKREYIASLMMQGFITNPGGELLITDIAKSTIKYTDILLKELEK